MLLNRHRALREAREAEQAKKVAEDNRRAAESARDASLEEARPEGDDGTGDAPTFDLEKVRKMRKKQDVADAAKEAFGVDLDTSKTLKELVGEVEELAAKGS